MGILSSRYLNFSLRVILAIAMLLIVWLFLVNIITAGGDKYFVVPLVVFVCLSLALLVPKRYFHLVIRCALKRKFLLWTAIVLCLTAIIFRLSFLFFPYEAGYSDPGMFYITAQAIADNSFYTNSHPGLTSYVANFPYLYIYDLLLGMTMKVVGGNAIAVILLNNILDFVGAFFLYLLIKRMINKKMAIIVGLLWIINPINIIFSAISLPIVAVNTFIIISIFLLYLLFSNMKNPKIYTPLAIAIAIGISFSIANAFRPIMVIFLIALVIYGILLYFDKPDKKSFIRLGVIAVVVGGVFLVGNSIYANIVSRATNYPATSGAGGWSVYVGSNYDAWGQWNSQDATYFASVIREEPTFTAAHERMRKEGVERWRALDNIKKVDLVIKKSIRLGGDQQHSIYNLDTYPSLWSKEKVNLLLWAACAIYTYFLMFMSFKFFYKEYTKKRQKVSFVFYLTLVFIGLFFAFLLVEVANRYFTPFYVFLTIFAICGIHGIIPKYKLKKVVSEIR